MSMREFLRGGYRTIREPTVVANHGRPVFTVMPINSVYSMEPPKVETNGHDAQERTRVR